MSETAWTFKGWYEEHGKTLNADRRARYNTDPEYREQVLETNRKARERKRQEALVEKLAQAEAITLTPKAKAWKETLIPTKRGEIRTFSIGALARALGRSVQAIRIWERKKLIPRPSLTNAKGDRLYTADDVANIHNILTELGKLGDERERPEPRQLWAEIKPATGKAYKTPMYRIGVLATALGRSAVTVEQMERREVLPETPFRNKGHRLYTTAMIESAAKMRQLHNKEIVVNDWKGFHAGLLKAWTILKVFDSTITKVWTAEE